MASPGAYTPGLDPLRLYVSEVTMFMGLTSRMKKRRACGEGNSRFGTGSSARWLSNLHAFRAHLAVRRACVEGSTLSNCMREPEEYTMTMRHMTATSETARIRIRRCDARVAQVWLNGWLREVRVAPSGSEARAAHTARVGEPQHRVCARLAKVGERRLRCHKRRGPDDDRIGSRQ